MTVEFATLFEQATSVIKRSWDGIRESVERSLQRAKQTEFKRVDRAEKRIRLLQGHVDKVRLGMARFSAVGGKSRSHPNFDALLDQQLDATRQVHEANAAWIEEVKLVGKYEDLLEEMDDMGPAVCAQRSLELYERMVEAVRQGLDPTWEIKAIGFIAPAA